jgi:hypothetical protein
MRVELRVEGFGNPLAKIRLTARLWKRRDT